MNKVRIVAINAITVGLLVNPVSGVAAQSAPPADLDTRSVGPGVVRLMGDGAGHAFVFDGDGQGHPRFDGIATAPDGGVYVIGHMDDLPRSGLDQYVAALWQIGQRGATDVRVPSSLLDIATGPDGTVWAAGEGRYLARFTDGAWKVVRPAQGYDELLGLSVGGDGTVWGAWRGPLNGREQPGVIARFDGKDWVDVIGDQWARYGGRTIPFKMAATPDGALWAGLGPGGTLARYEAGSWELAWPLGDGMDHAVHALAVGPDGKVWALLETFSPSAMHLARLDADGWTTWSADDGMPQEVSQWLEGDWLQDRGRYMEIDPEGRAWMLHRDGGLVAFDGTTSTRYLRDVDITHFAIGPDGCGVGIRARRQAQGAGPLPHRSRTRGSDQKPVAAGAGCRAPSRWVQGGPVWLVPALRSACRGRPILVRRRHR